ncbi:FAD-dependent oxidoreductase [Cyanobacterium aponinum AL20118]|uniref:FAD-dependent oxidoreductase n=1 Tax=Cyanobacterium aponinum AL20115 TaxID=3090662 RepID=A0AAF0ZGB2_9CHRO|nr:FAD-dependent oxidoreductase [Cyanobacterium aponinum]WPF88804.1 FAD-dependent oxidoreductase [Cyanobacterium aponinum AL20115]
MNNYDVIIIGGGLTGSVLSYELAKKNLRVLLLEKDSIFNNATVYSYGGISYWCGTDETTIKLCQEGINIYRNLTEELDYNIDFRELDLLFTIDKNQDPESTFQQYQKFHIAPKLLDKKETNSLEPLINIDAISGSLRFPQGHVHPEKMIFAYQKALMRLGGKVEQELVISVEKNQDKIIGVKTEKNSYSASQIILCAGAFSRSILQNLGINLPLYFSHAQLIMTPPAPVKLKTLVMPCTMKRLDTEKQVAQSAEKIWQKESNTLYGDVLEAGAIQFLDGSFCLGQISQIIPNLNSPIDSVISEKRLRDAIASILPSLANLSGKWHNCQVAFTEGMPFLVGKIGQIEGLSIFSGFTSPFVFVPPLARYFADYLVNGEETLISFNL